uniref:Transposase n=1 Tax=Ascaris lumbricoides TaxID=6252 RepID=A0A0M3IVT9_ASCLU
MNENGIILGKEQKARLEANRSILERQEEELRALGVLP